MNGMQKIKLMNEIRDAMSPQAVALMVAHLQSVGGPTNANLEVAWFRDALVDLVGGPDAVNVLFEEVGV